MVAAYMEIPSITFVVEMQSTGEQCHWYLGGAKFHFWNIEYARRRYFLLHIPIFTYKDFLFMVLCLALIVKD